MDLSQIKKELEAISARKAALLDEQTKIEELEKAFSIVSQHLTDKAVPPPAATNPPGKQLTRTIIRHKEPALAAFAGVGSKTDAIVTAMKEVPEHFTLSDIYDVITRRNIVGINKNDVSFALSRMKKSGKLYQVKPGSGKSPSIYSIKDPKSSNESNDLDEFEV